MNKHSDQPLRTLIWHTYGDVAKPNSTLFHVLMLLCSSIFAPQPSSPPLTHGLFGPLPMICPGIRQYNHHHDHYSPQLAIVCTLFHTFCYYVVFCSNL